MVIIRKKLVNGKEGWQGLEWSMGLRPVGREMEISRNKTGSLCE